MERLVTSVGALIGLLAIGNAIAMLVDPVNWYFAVPGVTGTGPYNAHFLRDIGLIFLGVGAAMIVGAARRAARPWLWSAAALWLSGHALFHFWEVAVGICGPSSLVRDFPAVTLPAILTAALAVRAVWAGSAVDDHPAIGVQHLA